MTTQLGNIFISHSIPLPLWDERHIMLGQVASQTITGWLIKRCHREKESEGGRQKAWNWGKLNPLGPLKWWMCYDGPAPAHKHVTYSKTKETSFYCPSLGIFHEHAHSSLCLSLFLCFILSLTGNDSWRLCRSSKVIEDHSQLKSHVFLYFTQFFFLFFSVWLSFVPVYILNVYSYDFRCNTSNHTSPKNEDPGIIYFCHFKPVLTQK